MPDPVTAITGAVTVGSGLLGASSAKSAAKKQAKAADKASDVTLQMYQQTRQDLAPYAAAGQPALNSILAMYGLTPGSTAFGEKELAAFRAAPDYQIAQREGIRALDNSAAARGELKSGRTMQGVMDYASDLGTRKLETYLNRLYSLAGMGQDAAAGQGASAQAAGSSLANLAIANGEAQASGIVGAGNAMGSALGNLGSNLAFMLERNNPSAYRPASLY